MLETKLKNYWTAMRRLRLASDRQKELEGPFKLAVSLEKDPRLRAMMVHIYNQEQQQPA